MARGKTIGKIEPVHKIWLSTQEAAAYLGVSTRFLRDQLDVIPGVEVYNIGGNKKFYRLENLDRLISQGKVK
ncbi:DNA-binding protein [Parabacteroides sp. AF48-14]|uniref:DNA-binding protein n=1 Tax=Parabacteroides sp. AF48-14 TaxID=2292052 RepID=UPI000EFF439D|nr:DNA-binding protein [Parabacteroides sp. AF48-14]RHO73259.1 DNA-binding protein [Parabacteroides sp. AF48-14]